MYQGIALVYLINIYGPHHFLNVTSTREQFAFLVYSYRVKAVFHNLRTICFTGVCVA